MQVFFVIRNCNADALKGLFSKGLRESVTSNAIAAIHRGPGFYPHWRIPASCMLGEIDKGLLMRFHVEFF